MFVGVFGDKPAADKRIRVYGNRLVHWATMCLIAVLALASLSRDVFGCEAHQNGGVPVFFNAELVARPTTLNPAAGSIHQAVTTDIPEAQAFYDQGLAWTHSYGWIEAARAFHAALRHDPNLAMAELRLARAYREMDSSEDADMHFRRAQELAPTASEKDRRILAAHSLQWEAIRADGTEKSEKHAAYRTALDNLMTDYPDEPEFWLARGNAEEGSPESKGQNGGESTIRFYDEAVRLNPNHPGAHHYLVHTYENMKRYEDAARHAEIYARLAPGAPHAQHMYGHILPTLGRWDEAAVQFEKANALENAYYLRENVESCLDWHHIHNLTLLGWTYMGIRRYGDAAVVLKEAFEMPARGKFGGLFEKTSYVYLALIRKDYDRALTAAQKLGAMGEGAGKAVSNALIGQIRLEMGETDAAFDAARDANEALNTFQQESEGKGNGWAVDEAKGYLNSLQALLDLRDADARAEAAKTLRKQSEDFVNHSGFDGWGEGSVRVTALMGTVSELGQPELASELNAIRESVSR